MATVTFNVSTDMRTFAGFDFSEQLGSSWTATGTADYYYLEAENFYHRLTGTGLDFGSYFPGTGTVTSWAFGAWARNPNPDDPFNIVRSAYDYWTFDGISVPAGDLRDAIIYNTLASLMPSLLSADDLIVGSVSNDYLFGYDGNDSLFGGTGIDDLNGGAGNDRIDGGIGADAMRGGGGNDTYYVDNTRDRAIETSVIGGTDTVRSSVTFTLGANIENLVLGGSAGIDGAGNGLDNIINGNNGANSLSGGDGNDRLDGRGSTDRLDGDSGHDLLSGGDGNDWIRGGTGADRLYGGTGADTFLFSSGDLGTTGSTTDRVQDFAASQGDRLHFSHMDANSANGGATNEAFVFIGTSGFHDVAGELRYQQINGNTYVYGDTDGDGAADFVLRVDGLHSFVAGDFVL